MTTYKEINDAWPEPIPVPTNKEAIAGTKRLIRRAFAIAKAEGRIGFAGYTPYMKRSRFKITSGNRYTYPRNFVWHVNPNGRHFGGWKDIVHGVSHWASRRWWPKLDPHSAVHAWMESELASYAIANFLSGQLARPEKPRPDRKTIRAARALDRLTVWRRKRARADTAIRKLIKTVRRYEQEGLIRASV